MKIRNLYFTLLSILIFSNSSLAQPNANNWTWQTGNNMPNQLGAYGPSVITPGKREPAGRWVYNNKLYIFGGSGGQYNDLWAYDHTTNNWTWIKGSNIDGDLPVYGIKNLTDINNNPGGRSGCSSWIYNDKFYMFGGFGFDKNGELGLLNDLWEYDPATNNWTWKNGSDIRYQAGTLNSIFPPYNYPGAREEAASAVRNNKLILFGGGGIDVNGNFGFLNDLWEYSHQTNEWIHKTGPTIINDPGAYNGNTNDYPAARKAPSFWDNDGTLYIMGGTIFDGTIDQAMNDFWRFDYNTNSFTLISGSNTYGVPPIFGQLGVPDFNTSPGSITSGNCYSVGNSLYYFAGTDVTGNDNYNALWKYNTESNIWIWIKGSNTCCITGEYGTLGIEHPNNNPAPNNEGGPSLSWVYNNKLYINDMGANYIHLCAFNLATQNWATVKILERNTLYGNIGLNNNNIQKPGARAGASGWEYNGKMYLWGGKGNSAVNSGGEAFLNDLWQYDPAIKEWVWLSGSHLDNAERNYGIVNVPAATNNPGARDDAHTCKIGDKIYLFGGTNNSLGNNLSDLWEYNHTTNLWTWIKGVTDYNASGVYGTVGVANTSNMPGARIGASFVSLNNKLYLFGGLGIDSFGVLGYLNDLWVFDPTTNNWTWLKGDKAGYQGGNFGTINVANSSNKPNSSTSHISWAANNKLYIFGGYNYNPINELALGNTLWEYNPLTNNWTWLKGNNDNQAHAGIYGTIGVASPTNNPGSRIQGAGFTHEGRLYLFGGYGFANTLTSFSNSLSDLWEYNTTTNNWRWIKGPNLADQSAILGTQGIPALSNNPAGTILPTGTYVNNKFYILGGYSYGVGINANLWEYVPANNCTSMSTVASGNWNNEATWSCGRLPLATEIVTINNHIIDLTTNGFAKNIIYNTNATIRLGAGGNLILKP
jgi:N-acetylneuraminic acid mutarotase